MAKRVVPSVGEMGFLRECGCCRRRRRRRKVQDRRWVAEGGGKRRVLKGGCKCHGRDWRPVLCISESMGITLCCSPYEPLLLPLLCSDPSHPVSTLPYPTLTPPPPTSSLKSPNPMQPGPSSAMPIPPLSYPLAPCPLSHDPSAPACPVDWTLYAVGWSQLDASHWRHQASDSSSAPGLWDARHCTKS